MEFKTYKLKHPIGDITELKIRTEPTFRDYFGVKIGKDRDIDIKAIAQLIANLSNQPIEMIGRLKKEDWENLTEEVSGFF